MFIGLENNYGYDKHELMTKVEDNFEYAGTDTRKGITYDCYLVPDGITYKAVCVKRKQNYCFKADLSDIPVEKVDIMKNVKLFTTQKPIHGGFQYIFERR